MKLNKILIIILTFLILMQSSFAISVKLISTNPAPIVAGDYADITLRFTNPVSNLGTPIENLNIGIQKTNFIEPIEKIEYIGIMQSGESITRTYRVFMSSNLKQGFVDLPIDIKYKSINFISKVKIYISNSKTNPQILIGQINSIPNQILQDTKNNKLNINLQNLGDKSADLLTINLITNSTKITPSYSYSFEDSIASIGPGNSSIATFTLDVKENVQDQIPAKLLIRYRAKDSIGSSYKIINKTINFKIKITPAPYLVVSKVEELSDFKIGTTENLVKITIKNEGKEDATEVRVRAVSDISYPLIYEETTKYVTAKIKPGNTASVIFKIEVTKNGDVKDYNSILILESIVGESRYSREDTFKIATSPGKNVNISFYAYLIVVVVVIISIIIGLNTYFSRKKKINK